MVSMIFIVCFIWQPTISAQTPTPRPMPTATPDLLNKVTFTSNNPESHQYKYGDIISLGVAMYATNESQRYTLSFKVGNTDYYYPTWTPSADFMPYLRQPSDLGITTMNLFTFTWEFYAVGALTFETRLYQPNPNGQGYSVIDTAQRTLIFNDEAPQGPCRRGYAVVELTNIPIMNEGTMDSLNKQLFFCMHDKNDVNFIGVYHRYLQPDYPYGPWWPTWRLEAGADGCVEEWNIWSSHDLDGTTATFLIEWSRNSVSVTHLGTNDRQTLHTENDIGLELLEEDSRCANWGWSSSARVRLVDMRCEESGEPSGCY